MIAEAERPRVEALIKASAAAARAGEVKEAGMTLQTAAPRGDPLPDDAPHVLVVDDDQKIRTSSPAIFTSTAFA